MIKRCRPTKLVLALYLLFYNIAEDKAEINLVNGSYEKIVIDIKETIPVANCTPILQGLESILTAASHHLFTAIDGRAYFGEFVINLPQAWPDECVPGNRTVSSSSGEKSDITVTGTHHLFGNRVWTKQSGGCEVPGDQIYISYHSFTNPTIAKEIIREWAKYRYGIFDEIGYDDDRVYPKCYFTNNQHITGCSDGNIKYTGICQNGSPYSDMRKVLDKQSQSSIMFVPQADHVTKFCEQANHDRYAPTKHNILCGRRSTMEIILEHKDFKNKVAPQPSTTKVDTTPVFEYRRRKLTRYVVVIDETQSALQRESWSFLRSAIRKWVLYDLRSNTEIGLVLADHTSTVRTLEITPLEHQKNRDLVASFVPYVPGDSSRPACMDCGINEAIRMLVEKRKVNGAASAVVLIIAPGMYLQGDINQLTNLATKNSIKICTINYPHINRLFPLDKLAELTSGRAFTVLEKRYNSEKSNLNTYFELSVVLFHISAEYHEGPTSLLPIEIHRRELGDVSSDSNSTDEVKKTVRTINGNFYLDDTLRTPSGLYVYTHNVEQPLIQNLLLLGPNNKTNYTIRSDQRIPVKQLTLIALINETGSWSYIMERFKGNPQPHFVQIIATPASIDAAFFHAKSWLRKYNGGGPLIVYCEIFRGDYPVHSAFIEVTVTRPNSSCNSTERCVEKFQLVDSGGGDPDITKGDGIYSRYFSPMETGPGRYKFEVVVNNSCNETFALSYGGPNLDIPCCGSELPNKMMRKTTPFQRYLPPMTVIITEEDIKKEMNARIGYIRDLSVIFIDNGQIKLTWTTPDMGGYQVIRYDIKFALSIHDIMDNYETVARFWNHDEPLICDSGVLTNLIIDIHDEPSLFGRAVYFAVRPYSQQLPGKIVTGPISNPARTFIPINAKVTNPPTVRKSEADSSGQDDVRKFDGIDDSEVDVELDNKLKYAVPIIAGFICVLCVIAMYCIICIFRRHKEKAQEKNQKDQENLEAKPTKNDSNSCSLNHSNSTPDIRSRYQSPKNSTQSSPIHETEYANPKRKSYSLPRTPVQTPVQSYPAVEPADHHTIGIPVYNDDDGQKSLQGAKLQDNVAIEEINPSHHHIDQIEIIAPPAMYTSCTGVSIISSNSHTLPRQRRTLSPYESWSPSQLLHEHARRISPMEEVANHGSLCKSHKKLHQIPVSPDEISVNGMHQHCDRTSLSGSSIVAPPVPPLPPYGSEEYQPPPNCHPHVYGMRLVPSMSANQISQTYSTTVRTHPQHGVYSSSIQGSMNSVSSSDRRRRNITMV